MHMVAVHQTLDRTPVAPLGSFAFACVDQVSPFQTSTSGVFVVPFIQLPTATQLSAVTQETPDSKLVAVSNVGGCADAR